MDEIKFSNDPIEIVNDESSTPFPEDFLGNLKTPVLACKELTQAPIENVSTICSSYILICSTKTYRCYGFKWIIISL